LRLERQRATPWRPATARPRTRARARRTAANAPPAPSCRSTSSIATRSTSGRLRRHGHSAYLVGGCVRDLSLGLTPKDFDVATSAKPEEIRGIFRNCRIIGRRFRLAHVYFRGGKIIETATFRANITQPEFEEEGGEAPDLLIRQDNVFGTEEQDAQRRDFTINGLFFDPTSGRIIDHVGGRADLEARTVRMIGNPDVRLREDPVRILRAVRIAAKTKLKIDPELMAAMQRHKDEIARCSKPRQFEETMRSSAPTGRAPHDAARAGPLAPVLPALATFLDESLADRITLDLCDLGRAGRGGCCPR
jgi:poly(A) polymerase